MNCVKNKKVLIFACYMIKRISIQDYLVKNYTNHVAQSIYFSLNIMFLIKMIKNWCFDKSFLLGNESNFGFRGKNICLEVLFTLSLIKLGFLNLANF